MKRNALILSLLLSLNAIAPIAHAETCRDYAFGSLMAFGMITLAPTGTTMATMAAESCTRRDVIVNVKEDAIAYGLTGEVSPLLQQAVEQQRKATPELTDEEIVALFTTLEFNSELNSPKQNPAN